MNNSENTLKQISTNDLLVEIDGLKKQLYYEAQQHKHWEQLAMLFHDALWTELRRTQVVSEATK